jgi:hypothetical protein
MSESQHGVFKRNYRARGSSAWLYRVDFALIRQHRPRLAIELHPDGQANDRDQVRWLDLTSARWIVLVFHVSDFTHRAHDCRETLAKVIDGDPKLQAGPIRLSPPICGVSPPAAQPDDAPLPTRRSAAAISSTGEREIPQAHGGFAAQLVEGFRKLASRLPWGRWPEESRRY